MANQTCRHYRVAQKQHEVYEPEQEIKKAICNPYSVLLIIPCILSLMLGFCLGKIK